MRVCERIFIVGFGPGLDLRLPQGEGTPPAIKRGRTAGFTKKTGWPGLRRGGVGGYHLHSPPTVAHQPRAGCIRLVLFIVIVGCFKKCNLEKYYLSDLVVVVVRLPRPMEGNGVTPILRSLQN